MAPLPPLTTSDPSTAVVAVATQYPAGLVGLPLEEVRLSWAVASDDPAAAQAGYQLAWGAPGDPAALAQAEPVTGDAAIGVVGPGGPLAARERRAYRVRVATASGWTAWSAETVVEGGLGPADWRARLVSIPSELEGATPMLRAEFALDAPVASARLHASGLGFYEAWLNGRRTDDEAMNPGWTVYQRRVLVQTWDVTDLLRAGDNAVAVVLGDGWYRGRLGGQGRHGLWGDDLAALVQLEVELVDGRRVTVVSDGTWRGGFGAVTATCVYDGTTADLRLPGGQDVSRAGFDDAGWRPVRVLATDPERFVPRSAPGVRPIAELPMRVERRADRVDLDAGQNVAGWVRLTVRGRAGDTVTIRHAEVLEPDGTLHTHSLRHARPVDRYTLGHDGVSVLTPVHTYHGFRYCDVVGEAEVVEAVAVAVSCDLPQRSTFACSHAALTQFHSNALWSQRANFMSVPSDCPQRDERLGWTGDAAAFAATACTLVDVEPFWESWLRDLDLEQRADGSVPSTVPNVFELGDLVMNGVVADPWGRSGWADAVTLIPAAVYESYGDPAVLRGHLPAMRAWVEHLRRRAGDGVVIPDEPFQWGDWLDPDAPGGRPWESKVDPTFVSNAFYVRSARLLAAAERVAGDAARADEADALADAVAARAWQLWRGDAYTTQTGAAVALEYGVAPDDERAAVADRLAASVRELDGRIATGFVGARLILFALSRSGHLDEAYRMLLRREAPSWLYQVDRGATTVWERWDAIRPDGTIHTGAMDTVSDDIMVSFNHYAYGSMVDWVYRNVAGLEPRADGPGYRAVTVRPRPAADVTWARAGIETRAGRLAVDWRLTDDGPLEVGLTVPFGTTAVLDLPTTPGSRVLLDGRPAPARLTHGTHRITVTEPAVVPSGGVVATTPTAKGTDS